MLSPRPRIAPAPWLTARHKASQQNLWLGLLRSLIVIDTPTLVLGRRASPRRALSPPVVLEGSVNFTSRPPILPSSNFSMPSRRREGLRAHPPRSAAETDGRLRGALGTQIQARPSTVVLPLLSPLSIAPRLRKRAHTLGRLGTFNRSNNLVGSLPWYYRACWHQN